MSEWFDSQKKINSDFQKLVKERLEKANPRRELTAEESKRLRKLEGIADKLKRGENVQNLQPHLTKIPLYQLLLITYCKIAKG